MIMFGEIKSVINSYEEKRNSLVSLEISLRDLELLNDALLYNIMHFDFSHVCESKVEDDLRYCLELRKRLSIYIKTAYEKD